MQFIDESELERRKNRRERQRTRHIMWNVLTLLAVSATICLIGYFLLIYSNPYVRLNPFPPPTLPVLGGISTSTATQPIFPPTWTPTLKPTETPIPTETPQPVTASPTATVSQNMVPTFVVVDNGDFPYTIQGDPVAMANTVFHPGDSCDWQGLAGTVVDLQGKPTVGIQVRLIGFYDGRSIDMNTITGAASAWYGESGYEFVLGAEPLESNAALAVQLVDETLKPISNPIIFDTYTDCAKNLILINFKQIR